MIAQAQPRRFSHHALAVLAATMASSTLFALIWTAALGIAADARLPGMTWLATMAMLSWLSIFIVALPSASMALTLLWPVTRRGTMAGNGICTLAGAATGLILAPLASPHVRGTTLLQLAMFATIGAAIAVLYLILIKRFGRNTLPGSTPTRRRGPAIAAASRNE